MKLLSIFSFALLSVALIFFSFVDILMDGIQGEGRLAFAPLYFLMYYIFSPLCMICYLTLLFSYYKSYLNYFLISIIIVTSQCIVVYDIFRYLHPPGYLFSLLLFWIYASVFPCSMLLFIKHICKIKAHEKSSDLLVENICSNNTRKIIKCMSAFIITFPYIKVIFLDLL